jgi:hypothetical protein
VSRRKHTDVYATQPAQSRARLQIQNEGRSVCLPRGASAPVDLLKSFISGGGWAGLYTPYMRRRFRRAASEGEGGWRAAQNTPRNSLASALLGAEDGTFGGCLTDAEVEEQLAVYAAFLADDPADRPPDGVAKASRC